MDVKPVKHSLRKVSPLIFWVAWGYAFTNLLIGMGIWHTPLRALSFVFINSFFDNHFYAVLFIATGVIGAIGLAINSWATVRRVMMFGLTLKSLFFYALLLHVTWQSLGVVAIWTLIFWIQLLTVVFFPRVQKNGVI